MNHIDILIINYRSEEVLLDCLNSISEENIKYTVHILNNDVNVDLKKIIIDRPNIIIYESSKNLGFSAGVNLLVTKLNEPEYFFLLNPDAVLSANAIYNLYRLIVSAKNAAVISPLIINSKGHDWFRCGYINWRRSKIENVTSDYHLVNGICETGLFNGCAALINYSAFINAGMLDEKLFMYFDEAFFCMKLKKLNYKIYFTDFIQITHNVSFSTKKSGYLKTYYITRNGLAFFYIFNNLQSRTKVVSRYLYFGLYYVKHISPKSLFYYYKGIFDSIKLLNQIN